MQLRVSSHLACPTTWASQYRDPCFLGWAGSGYYKGLALGSEPRSPPTPLSPTVAWSCLSELRKTWQESVSWPDSVVHTCISSFPQDLCVVSSWTSLCSYSVFFEAKKKKHTISHFTVQNSVVLGVFTMFYRHHLYKMFSLSSKNPSSSHSHPHALDLDSIHFPMLGVSYKLNHVIYIISWGLFHLT